MNTHASAVCMLCATQQSLIMQMQCVCHVVQRYSSAISTEFESVIFYFISLTETIRFMDVRGNTGAPGENPELQ